MTLYCEHCKLPTVPLKKIETVDRERDVYYVSDCCEASLLRDDGNLATIMEIDQNIAMN